MRIVVAAVLVAAACAKHGAPSDRAPKRAGVSRMPVVHAPRAYAADPLPALPLLVVIDESSQLYVGAAASWAELATVDPLVGAKPVDDDALAQVAPPPPPPPEPPPEPPPVRLPDGRVVTSGERTSWGYLFEPQTPQEERAARVQPPRFEELGTWRDRGTVARLARVGAEIVDEHAALDPKPPALVLAAPTAPATILVHALELTHGLVAATDGHHVRPLRLELLMPGDMVYESDDRLELHLASRELSIIAMHDGAPSVLSGPIDERTLAAALATAHEGPVDVLVDPDVTAQQLVDVLVGLELAGVTAVGLGEAPEPGSSQERLRTYHEPSIVLGNPSSMGGVPKAVIRRVVKRQKSQLVQCYRSRLIAEPQLAGMVLAQFFITPKGDVVSASAAGVDPSVAECIAGVIRTTTFPRPDEPSGTQVNYPFSLRP